MKRFSEKVLSILFGQILGFLIREGKFPKKIEFWKNEQTGEIECNLYFCPNKDVKGEGPHINNEESDIPPFGYPDVRKTEVEAMLTKEDGLTDCERAYSQHLKANKLPKRGDAPDKSHLPGYLQ